MSYKLVVAKPAENDLADILQYISKDLSAPMAASDFLNEVLKCYDNVAKNPLMYALCDNERLRNKQYRKAIIKNYIMFYRVDETSNNEQYCIYYAFYLWQKGLYKFAIIMK